MSHWYLDRDEFNGEDLQAEVDAIPYWYHAIQLNESVTTPGWAPLDPKAYQVPEDLTGKRVLDIGAWDGYWTFDAVRRGAAEVVAIDDFSDTIGGTVNADRSEVWQTFDLCRAALNAKNCYRHNMSVYDIEKLGQFDVVYAFGLLYHLRYPLLALDKMRSVCTGSLHLETAILDNCPSPYGTGKHNKSECCAEFYPKDEYGLNESNWWVPTLRCAAALVQAAGFENVESWRLTENPQHISECRGFVSAC